MKSSDAKQLPAVRLRALEPEDLDFLYRIENDEALWAPPTCPTAARC